MKRDAKGLRPDRIDGRAWRLAVALACFLAPLPVAAQMAQSIAFPALSNRALTDPPLTVTATASSGSPVVFTSLSQSVCSVAGATVSLATLGTCTIAADQAGDATFAAASRVLRSFIVWDAAEAATARLGNISSRAHVLTGDDVMIGGFVIGGSTAKRVAVVATGPSLASLGISNALANPVLTLVRSSDRAVIATNDDWESGTNASGLLATGFAPADAREAAILTILVPGAYTAVVQGAGGTTGVSVIGVYEIDRPAAPLINISTRGQVRTGEDVLIGGFVISGSSAQTVAVVATGPSLSSFGIANSLANPMLTLVRSSDRSIVASNDNWQDAANAAQLQAKGFAPSHPMEAGILVTLPPGAYTAVVQGVGDTTGVALVGIYAAN